MALRGDCFIEFSDTSHILNDVAAPGVVLCYKTAGSGAVLGATRGECQLASNPSGLKVFGGLMQNVVSIDETRYHRNWHKNEQVVGEPVEVLRRGWFVTDKVSGTPTKGDKAYLTTNGNVTPTVSSTGGTTATPLVGEFAGGKDEDGFVKVNFNLPHAG